MMADRVIQLSAAFDVLLVTVCFVALRWALSSLNIPKPASLAVVLTLALAGFSSALAIAAWNRFRRNTRSPLT